MTGQNDIRILAGGAVITVDAERRILDPGAIVMQGSLILKVGERDEVLQAYPMAERIDLEHTVMLPGLIDTHGHAGHGLTKGIADGIGDEWNDIMEDIYFRSTDEAFWRAESFLSALEHLEFGVTTSLSMTGSAPRVDNPRYAVAASGGYAELGLRHIVALGPPGPPWPKHFRDLATGSAIEVSLDRALQTTSDTIDQIHGSADGRISVFVGPSGLVPEMENGVATDFSVRQMRGVLELALTKRTSIHAHAYAGQILAAANAFPEILGLHLSLAHCAGISVEEARIMAEQGVSASHGPLTHAFALARFPLIEALDAGVTVAISTDGSSPDRSFDLLSQGRVAAQLQRAHFADTTLLPAGKILEMMTIDAAQAIGMADRIGSLEAGKQADIIALNLRSARLGPRLMLLQRVVYAASGSDVEFVMVDGNVLRQHASTTGVDVDGILDDAQRAAEDAFERAGIESYLRQHPDVWRSVRYRDVSVGRD